MPVLQQSSCESTTTTTTTTSRSGAGGESHAIARKRKRCWPRLLLRKIVALIVLTASTITTFKSLNAIHGMEGLMEQRSLSFLQDLAPFSPATNQNGEEFLSRLSYKFAIVYMIGGCLPEDPKYRFYLYDILMSHDNMRREGSKADVIVFVQISFTSEFEALPDEDMRILVARNIQVVYIPKNEHESFYSIVLDKFRVLSLTQYDRVLFSDGDVVIRGSLDYLYELSMAGVLKENIVVAGKTEPANGGFFMLKPSDTASARLRTIIRDKEARGSQLEYPHFDRRVGWGHVFDGNDYYELVHGEKRSEWAFHGDFADQGLLYQWVKYEEKSVSILFRKGIQNWGVNASSGEVVLEAFHGLNVLDTFSNRTKRECWTTYKCWSPYVDYIHFTGKDKPWLRGPPDDWKTNTSAVGVWYREIDRLNQEFSIGLNFTSWRTGQRPLLGMFPLHISAALANYSSTAS